MLAEADVLDALRACFDPEIPLNVVDLGLVHAVRLQIDRDAPGAGIDGVPVRQRLFVEMLASSQDEGRRLQMVAQVSNRLAGMEGLSRVEVELLEQPVWNAGLVSAEGRKALGMNSAMFPILNNRIR